MEGTARVTTETSSSAMKPMTRETPRMRQRRGSSVVSPRCAVSWLLAAPMGSPGAVRGKQDGAMGEPVTRDTPRRAATERSQEMVAWMQAGIRLASDFPGFLGAGWVRPAADSDEWHLLYRFDAAGTLHDWDNSQQRAWWLGAGAPFVEQTRVERRTGIEGGS